MNSSLNVVDSFKVSTPANKVNKSDKTGGDDSFKDALKDAVGSKDSVKDSTATDKTTASKDTEDLAKPEAGAEEKDAQTMEEAAALVMVPQELAVSMNIQPTVQTQAQGQEAAAQAVTTLNPDAVKAETNSPNLKTAESKVDVLPQAVSNEEQTPVVAKPQTQQATDNTAGKSTEGNTQTATSVQTENNTNETAKTGQTDDNSIQKMMEKSNEETTKSTVVDVDGEKTVVKDRVNIKVGETYHTSSAKPEVLNTQSKTFPSDVADKILYHSDGKGSLLEMQLTPKELGKINIKVAFENGRAEISVICSNSKAMNLLAENARGICSIIENQTGAQATVTVETDKDLLQQQDRQDQNSNGQYQGQNDSKQNDRNQEKDRSLNFIQQLRLGLVPSDAQTDYDFVRM